MCMVLLFFSFRLIVFTFSVRPCDTFLGDDTHVTPGRRVVSLRHTALRDAPLPTPFNTSLLACVCECVTPNFALRNSYVT